VQEACGATVRVIGRAGKGSDADSSGNRQGPTVSRDFLATRYRNATIGSTFVAAAPECSKPGALPDEEQCHTGEISDRWPSTPKSSDSTVRVKVSGPAIQSPLQ